MLPGLPAYILFKMIRYTDHINNDDAVRSLIQGAITMVKKVVKKKGMNDIEVSYYKTFCHRFQGGFNRTYSLALLLEIWHCRSIKQCRSLYSGTLQLQLQGAGVLKLRLPKLLQQVKFMLPKCWRIGMIKPSLDFRAKVKTFLDQSQVMETLCLKGQLYSKVAFLCNLLKEASKKYYSLKAFSSISISKNRPI